MAFINKGKTRIIGVLFTMLLVGSMEIKAYASPQKPFDWEGYRDSYTFDWDENTTVEMCNGDGTDVKTVNGQYIIDHMLPGTCWPLATYNGGIPSNVATVSCQVIKEDAYIIMPFDGYVTIGLVDQECAGNYGTICVRAKQGDKVNMVPKNLVLAYDPTSDIDSLKGWEGTTSNDWTYQLRIHKEEFVPICDYEIYEPDTYRRTTDGRLISTNLLPRDLYSQALYDPATETYSCLWFIYQVDAPNTDIKAIPYDREAASTFFSPRFSSHNTDIEKNFEGWLEDPKIKGRWVYYANGESFCHWWGNFEIKYDLYQSGRLTVKDYELYIDGRKINTWPFYDGGAWYEPQYNIVNAQ